MRGQPQPTRPAIRYASPAQRRPGQKAKQRGFFERYPVATTLGVIIVLGLAVLYARQNKLGPWTPTAKPIAQATCDLKTHVCNKAPIMTINPAKSYIATIETAKGNIVIQLDAKNTPITVNNFVFLAQQHFYDNTYFWRVEAPGLTSPLDGSPSQLQLIQGGSVTKTGRIAASIPGYFIKDEKVVGDYTAGDVAMANEGKANTGSTQFFILTGDNSKMLSKTYTIFGHVTSGLDVATKISPDDIIKTVTIQVK